MKIIDHDASEKHPQRLRGEGGRLIHCCCICGKLDVWGEGWSAYYSAKELDDEVAIPKFCSKECRASGGPRAGKVTPEMKEIARGREYRAARLVYREATEAEKYRAAVEGQRPQSPRR